MENQRFIPRIYFIKEKVIEMKTERNSLTSEIIDKFIERYCKLLTFQNKNVLITNESYNLFFAGQNIYNETGKILESYRYNCDDDEDFFNKEKLTKKQLLNIIENYERELSEIDIKLKKAREGYEKEVQK